MRNICLLIFFLQIALLHGQELVTVPFQLNWSSFPFSLASGRIEEINFKVEELRTPPNRKRVCNQPDEYRRAFDSIGREITTLNAMQISQAFQNEIILMGYDSHGCPEYNNFPRDQKGWVRMSKVAQIANHCSGGLVDTVIENKTYVYHYDSLKRVVSVDELLPKTGSEKTQYAYDNEGRLISIFGNFLDVRIHYQSDSILVFATNNYHERMLAVYLIGSDGLPVSSTLSELRRNNIPKKPIQKTTYTYNLRKPKQ